MAKTTGELGVMNIRSPDGKITVVKGNRAQRRRIIKENKLKREGTAKGKIVIAGKEHLALNTKPNRAQRRHPATSGEKE